MMGPPDAEGERDDNVYPDNVSPIRQDQMMFIFNQNTPIEDPATLEIIECRRYEEGICRECNLRRGQWTPWCRDHYPHRKDVWQERWS